MVFEALPNVGGVFESGGRGPGGYANARLTTSTSMIMFSDYRWESSWAEQATSVKSCKDYGATVRSFPHAPRSP